MVYVGWKHGSLGSKFVTVRMCDGPPSSVCRSSALSTVKYEPRHVKRGTQTLILECFSCEPHKSPIISLHEVKRTLPHFKDDFLN